MLAIRFSVRFLLLITLATAAALCLLRFAKEPPTIVRRIESLGGEFDRRVPWWAPAEQLCGRFRGVETVLGVSVENDELNDRDLVRISKLRSVSYVTVMSNNVTDDGLSAVCSLPKLVGLAVRCTAITDKGLAIAKSRELDFLYVESDGVTGSFLKPLRPAFLPAAHELDESSRWVLMSQTRT